MSRRTYLIRWRADRSEAAAPVPQDDGEVEAVHGAVAVDVGLGSTFAIGIPDGGPGLPFLNWSMTGGDLRIGHALGLHGLQVMPTLGYLITKRRNSENGSLVPVWALKTFGVLYGTMFLITLLQALQGRTITSLWG